LAEVTGVRFDGDYNVRYEIDGNYEASVAAKRVDVKPSVRRRREEKPTVEEEQQVSAKKQRTATTPNIKALPGDELLQRSEQSVWGFVGVWLARHSDQWRAAGPKYRGARTDLGTYASPLEAARARRDYLMGIQTKRETGETRRRRKRKKMRSV